MFFFCSIFCDPESQAGIAGKIIRSAVRCVLLDVNEMKCVMYDLLHIV